jgi:hypothetical protein
MANQNFAFDILGSRVGVEKMGKGLTLSREELRLRTLKELLNKIDL